MSDSGSCHCPSLPGGEATGAQFDAPVSNIKFRLCPVLLLLSAASAAVCTVTHAKRFERSPHDDMSVQPWANGGGGSNRQLAPD
jgi:hypothetical protein